MRFRHDTRVLASGQRARRGAVRGTALWLLGALTAGVLALSTFTVPEGEVVVVARFGDPRRLVEDAGLHFKWPSPIDSLYRIDTRTHVLDPEVGEFLTDDQKQVEVDAFVAWRVSEPQTFLTSLRSRAGAEERIGQVLQASLGEVLKRGPFDDLVSIEDRARTLGDVREELTRATAEGCRANGYGVEIALVGIERITFPDDNKPAVEGAMREERNKEAARIESEGKERANEIDTDTDAEVAELETAATAEAAELRARGVAEAKEIEKQAYALAPELFDQLAKFEVLEKALRGSLIVLPSDHWLATSFAEPPAVPAGFVPFESKDAASELPEDSADSSNSGGE